MHLQNWFQSPSQWCLFTQKTNTASHPIHPTFYNDMAPDNEKILSFPLIQLFNSNAIFSSWSIISEVSTTTAFAMHSLTSMWNDDKIEKNND